MSAGDDQRQLDRARDVHRLGTLERKRRRLRQQAGRAATDPEAVNLELGEAIDVFASEPWTNLTLEELEQAGRRIMSKAGALRSANALPTYDEAIEKLREKLRDEGPREVAQ